MKLYRDYKNEQELQRKAEEDRKNLGISKEITIIYESSPASKLMKSIISILLLLVVFALIAFGIVLLAFYSSQMR